MSRPASSLCLNTVRIQKQCRSASGPTRPTLLTALAMLIVLGLPPLPPARALPFDPVPSSFQRWLNAASGGAAPLPVLFDQLGRCTDNSQPSSPYRSPNISCTGGVVALRTMPSHRCSLDRLTYTLTDRKLRIQLSTPCPWSEAIPRSISLQNRARVPSKAGS